MNAAVLPFLLLATGQTEPGVSFRLYDVGRPMTELAELVPGQTPNIDRLLTRINLKEGEFFGFSSQFIVEVTGELLAEKDGDYGFRLASDDGSELQIDGKVVLSHDGVHPASNKEGTVRLKAGWHPFRLRYFENDGQESLRWDWRPPGVAEFDLITSESMRVPKGLTRVTSPGPKKVIGLGGPARPGSGMPLEGLHPGLDIMTIRPEEFKPKSGGVGFLPDGRLLVSTFEPNQGGQFLPELRDGALWALEGVTGNDRSKITVRKVADGIQEPLGLAVIGNDVYLSTRTEIVRMVDKDGDGFYEGRQVVGSGWKADNYHHFTFGLVEKDGWLYGALSTAITFGARGINGPNPPYRGSVFRIDPKAYDAKHPLANIEFLTSGHRTPNGLVIGPGGDVFVGENQGAWQPSNKLNHVVPGRFFGHYNNTDFKNASYPNGGVPGLFDDRPLSQPAVYIPQNEGGNSPSQSLVIPEGKPFAGQMLMADVKYGGLHRVFLEKVGGEWQGGFVHFTQGFESGINRLAWGPDGGLYLAGIGASETWGWTDPKTRKETTFGLQRVRFNGKSTFEIESVSATNDGFVVRFTEPAQGLADVSKWTVRQWNYEPTPDYGGDKMNRQALQVKRAWPARDGKSVRLMIPGLKAGRVVYLNGDLKSKGGTPLWSTETWYTLNQIPKRNDTTAPPRTRRMLVFSKTAGFRHGSIAAAQQALMRLDPALKVEVTEDAAAFTPENLKRFDLVGFVLTTGDVLNPSQEAALEAYVRGGGGFVGVHSATDTEYDWPFYAELAGAHFKSHPEVQAATVRVEDPKHPTTRLMPKVWQRVDEWYDFKASPRGKVRVLASLDESTYKGGTMGKDHPIVWCREIGKGRAWYTGMGHTDSTWREQLFLGSLYDGIVWAARR
ncbi:MAG: ThuA domain-containing protein [Fimbriimonas sp.]